MVPQPMPPHDALIISRWIPRGEIFAQKALPPLGSHRQSSDCPFLKAFI